MTAVSVADCGREFFAFADRERDHRRVPFPGSWMVEAEKPWRFTIWELLETKAPSPALARPYCCYISTVIFYLRPAIVRPWHRLWHDGTRLRAQKPGGHLEEWDRVDARMTWDTPIWRGPVEFRCGGGQVVWHRRRWWMKHWARRVEHGR